MSKVQGPEGRKIVAGGEAQRTPGRDMHGKEPRLGAKDQHSAAPSGLVT